MKLCKDCKWAYITLFSSSEYLKCKCNDKERDVSQVTGDFIFRLCKILRLDGTGRCGVEGRWWEPK